MAGGIMASTLTAISPGLSLGQLHLGASIHEILSLLTEDKDCYPVIDLHYSPTEPLTTPVIVSLPQNGLRLRFDGANQLLRLIEVVDFTKIRLAYKSSELSKAQDGRTVSSAPAFKRVYQAFGASYPGEYLPPKDGARSGTYVLSWTGVAFTFPLQHSAWSAGKDHVSLLGSSAAAPAANMALFDGSSWPDARKDLFVQPAAGSRPTNPATHSRESLPPTIECANVLDNGLVELIRQSPAAPFSILLNRTTPQDLITELGPPDATHKRDNAIVAPEQPARRRRSSASRPLSNGRPHPGSQPSSYSSTGTDTFDTDFDSADAEESHAQRATREVFWCYFGHGMDILIGPPNELTIPDSPNIPQTPLATSPHLVVLKVILHGNVPGSYAFNRHRRLRWTLSLPFVPYANDLTSESSFEQLKPILLHAFQGVWPASEMGRGKVVNRTWGGNASDSTFFLPDAGEDLVEGGGSEQWLGNTRLYTFPGFVFEVLENGSVSALTVCLD